MKATAVKEKPILFSSEMIRALLSGRKTMTRRIVKPQPVHDETAWACYFDRPNRSGQYGPPCWGISETPGEDMLLFCPYGGPGDRLWVREAWIPDSELEDYWGSVDAFPESKKNWESIEYRADVRVEIPRLNKWRPSIHMPRWASRITLEITDVRVERVQDISERDAEAEGVGGMRDMRFASALGNIHSTGHRLNFMDLWNKINGPGSWESNPFVWALTFKRSEAQP